MASNSSRWIEIDARDWNGQVSVVLCDSVPGHHILKRLAATKNGIHRLVPVPRHIANVQMIGIARLRYRPHTNMTRAWWADLNANAEKHLAKYAEIAARQFPDCSVDCSIKEASR